MFVVFSMFAQETSEKGCAIFNKEGGKEQRFGVYVRIQKLVCGCMHVYV
jgi:hypothetical protein